MAAGEVQFDPSIRETDLQHYKVERIELLASFPYRYHDMMVNNWTINLISPGDLNIRLSMHPNYKDIVPSMLKVSMQSYSSIVFTKKVEFQPKPGLNVKELLDFIVNQNLHQFLYGDQLLECRHWTYEVICQLINGKIINDTGSDMSNLSQAVGSSWSASGEELDYTPEWTEGTFLR